MKINLLLIDDEIELSQLYTDAICRQTTNVTVDTAMDRASMQSLVRTTPYHIILIDYHVKNVSGFELLSEVKLAQNDYPDHNTAYAILSADSSVDPLLKENQLAAFIAKSDCESTIKSILQFIEQSYPIAYQTNPMQAHITKMRANYLVTLQQAAPKLQKLYQTVAAHPTDIQSIEQLFLVCHQFSGSAVTFHLDALGEQFAIIARLSANHQHDALDITPKLVEIESSINRIQTLLANELASDAGNT